MNFGDEPESYYPRRIKELCDSLRTKLEAVKKERSNCKGEECSLGSNCFKNDPNAESCSCGFIGDREIRAQLQKSLAAIREAIRLLVLAQDWKSEEGEGCKSLNVQKALASLRKMLEETPDI